MPSPLVILVVVVLWIASLAGVGVWQRGEGVTSEKVKDQTKQIMDLRAANQTITDLQNRARENEHMHDAELAAIGERHAQEMEDAEKRRRDDVAAARAGALRLRVAGACKQADRGAAGEAPIAARASDDSSTGELPREVTADLFGLADDADRNTKQLGECQAVVLSDRETLKGATP